VLLNDGQDFLALNLERRLRLAFARGHVGPRIVVGIHADERRMREYGTSNQPNDRGLGDLANAYRIFIVDELMPFLRRMYRLRRHREFWAIGGFSLGALSAFDIGYKHESSFADIGCFSASFWWRSTPFNPAAPDENRIVIDRIRRSSRAADLRYFFMVGSDEETSDRNNNGIIDAVDDTLDVIAALRDKGVSGGDITYHFVEGGEHNQATWGPALITWMALLPV